MMPIKQESKTTNIVTVPKAGRVLFSKNGFANAERKRGYLELFGVYTSFLNAHSIKNHVLEYRDNT